MDLLVQSARYAEPALEELDGSLLPGVAALRPKIKDAFAALFDDDVRGCPELLVLAAQGEAVEEHDPRRLLTSMSTLPKGRFAPADVWTEPQSARRSIRRRLELLSRDIGMRRAYRNLLVEVWELARPAWQRRGRAVAARAAAEWSRSLRAVATARALTRLMPPRHPLARRDKRAAADLFRRRRRATLVPVYFCMSGGQLADIGDRLLIGVPASALEPARRTRDAAFVAYRLRSLAEPTRVHILIHLMSTPCGVMEMTRALGMTQPTVSEHVRVLIAAGLVRRLERGGRTVLIASPEGLDRLLEDARATVSRWR